MHALTAAALILSFAAGLQQSDNGPTATRAANAVSVAARALELPFKVGEVLTYEASFSKFIFSGTIGELTLAVLAPADPSRSKMLELRADAVSKGFFPALVGLKVKDRFTAFINPIDFGLEVSKRAIEEKKTRRKAQSTIKRDAARLMFVDTDLSKNQPTTTTKEAPSPCWTLDVLSAAYFARFQTLRDGDVLKLPITDLGSNYEIELA